MKGMRKQPGLEIESLLAAAESLDEAVRGGEVLECLARLAVENTGASSAAAADAGAGVVVRRRNGEVQATDLPYGVSYAGLCHWVVAHGRPYVATEADGDERLSPLLKEALGFHSTAAVPLIERSGEVTGCLQIFAGHGGVNAASLAALEALARLGAAALRRARRFEKHAGELGGLKMAAERFQTLAESSSDFVWEMDAQGRYTYCSPQVRELLGYEPRELIGRTPFDLMPEEEARRLRPEMERCFAEHCRLVKLENVNLSKDGARVVMQTSGAPYLDANGGLLGYRGVDRDITEQRRALELVRRHAELEHLLATIARRFINLEAERIGAEIEIALGEVGTFADADRAHVMRFSDDLERVTCTHEWCREGVPSDAADYQDISVRVLPWAMRLHLDGEVVRVPRVRDLPLQAAAERRFFESQRIQSLLCVPLLSDHTLLGFVGLESVQAERSDWSESTVSLLRLAGSIFASALERKRSVEELREATRALKGSEAALSESQRMLQLVLDTIPVRVFWKNRNSVFLGCNESFATDAGVRSPSELAGKTDFDVEAWRKEAELYRTDDHEVVTTGRSKLAYREPQTRPDGEHRVLRTSKVPLRNAEGEIIGVLGTYEDVTEQQRGEEALRDSEARLRGAVLNAPLPAAIYAEDGEMMLVNEAWCELSGYGAEELRTVDDWLRRAYGEHAALVAPAVARTFDLQGREDEGEFEIRTRSDERRVWDFSCTPLGRLPDGRRIVLTMAKDVTERRRAEEQVRELNVELEQRVVRRTMQLRSLALKLTQVEQQERHRIAHVLHESLQQLLVGAKLSIGVVEKATSDAARARAAKTARLTVEKAIQLSRSLTVELRPPVLYELGLIPALEWLGRQMKSRHGLTVDVQAQPDAEPVSDNVRIALFEAVRELLLNVVKHAATERAEVRLTRGKAGAVQVAVTDRGTGFDLSVLHDEASVGFGLFSIRERIESFGGRVEIESHPGDGTTVRITVAAGASAPEAQPDLDTRLS